ncbi:MAG: NAD-dependent protein deacylase [Bacillota bacterium]|nr:NAD-dependent protein deacylase [Bacillota bacterium]
MRYNIGMNRTEGSANLPRAEAVQTLANWIREAKRIVFFGGAGVSTESGVPDYRSADGIYAHEDRAEATLTPRVMYYEPERFWRFYRRWFMPEGVKPNPAHRVLAELEARGKLTAIVTQNVDNLHQDAGSQHVLELHGNGTRFYCLDCQRNYNVADVREMSAVPRCSCGGRIRPDIVLYEEGLDGDVMNESRRAIRYADLLIIGGTSLAVWPAAGLLMDARPSARVVLINREDVSSAVPINLMIREPIGAFLADVLAAVDATDSGDKPDA